MSTTDKNSSLQKIRELIKDIDFCMLTTLDEKGELHSRPMSTNGKVDFDGDLWFFTYASTSKVTEINHQSKVDANFADPKNQTYISMSGNATVVRDRSKMEQLWLPELKAWFPKGLDEPDIALLKVSVDKAEYWDGSSSFVSHAIGLVSALMTGKPAKLGEHEKIEV